MTRWVRALFGGQLLPPQQQTELFSLVSKISEQPIATTSSGDPSGFSLGVGQEFALPGAVLASPIWYYQGEALGYRVRWALGPGDDLVVVIAVNSSSADNTTIPSLYQAVLGILEPQSVINTSAPPPR